MQCWASILFGLLVLWTGLLRCVQSRAYEPDALWFCVAMGGAAITAGFLFRARRRAVACVAGCASGVIVLAYYFQTFVRNPQEDATHRVAIVIVAAVAYLVMISLPSVRTAGEE